jgi:hypothetical protein
VQSEQPEKRQGDRPTTSYAPAEAFIGSASS